VDDTVAVALEFAAADGRRFGMAAVLSQQLGWIGAQDVARIRALIVKAGLPDIAPNLGAEKYLDLMGLDKKVEGGKLRFVLLKAIGNAVVSEAPAAPLLATLEACHG